MKIRESLDTRACPMFGRVPAALLAVSFLVSSSGCTVNPGGTGDAPPDIPPSSTFAIDFSDFSVDGVNATPAQVGAASNWVWAAGNVAVWNVIVTVTMAIPVAAYAEALNQVPRQDASGTWIWEYDFVVGGVTHSAELQAALAGLSIEWTMLISKDGEFANVNWYSGVSNLNGTAGTWRLNRDPQNVTPFVDIVWNRDPATGVADIKYTNVVPDGPENGGFISFAILAGAGNDRVYQIFDKGADNLIDIEWVSATKDGRVKDAAHFGDEEWHCWDAMLMDTACVDTTAAAQ